MATVTVQSTAACNLSESQKCFRVSPSVCPFWIANYVLLKFHRFFRIAYYVLLKFRRFFRNLLEFVTYLIVVCVE